MARHCLWIGAICLWLGAICFRALVYTAVYARKFFKAEKCNKALRCADGLGRSGRWHWSLPGVTNSAAKDVKNSYECHDLNVAALGNFGTLRDKGDGP